MEEDFYKDFDKLVNSYENQDLMLFEPANLQSQSFGQRISASKRGELKSSHGRLNPLPSLPEDKEILSLNSQISEQEALISDQRYQIEDLQSQIVNLEKEIRYNTFDTPTNGIVVTRKTAQVNLPPADPKKTRLPTAGGGVPDPDEIYYKRLYEEIKKKYDLKRKELQTKGKIIHASKTNLRPLQNPNI